MLRRTKTRRAVAGQPKLCVMAELRALGFQRRHSPERPDNCVGRARRRGKLLSVAASGAAVANEAV
eukprot:2465050-Lingulodinium_polyedra.AAC.1